MTFIFDLGDTGRDDLALVGGKAANLGELVRAGFPVPAGFVVSTAAYAAAVAGAGLADAGPETLHERLPTVPLPHDVADAVGAAYRQLGAPRVAVRSSGVAEDLADASFAGQHDTFLDVSGERDLEDAVRRCWASLWTPRAVAYRARAGYESADHLALAVVVQVMVDAEWAGVLFTADPVSGRRDQLVVEAVAGLGESLVSGTATGHRHVLAKGEVPASSDSPVPAAVLAQLAELGGRVEEAFGAPQDVEWAYAAGRCELVQARPLTALPEPAPTEPDQPRDFRWQQLYDHMPQPPYPVDCALVLRPLVCQLTALLGSAGYTVSRADEILVEGDHAPRVVLPDVRPTRRAVYRLPALLPRLVHALRTTPDVWRAHFARTLEPLAERALTDDLTALTDAELLDLVHTVVRAQAALVPGRFAAAVPTMLFAEKLWKRLLGLAASRAERDQLYADLLSGVPTITSSANEELAALAHRVRTTPELADVYARNDPADVPGELAGSAEGTRLLADVDGYLGRYGYRQVVTPLPGFETLAETPHRVHAMVKGLASGAAAAPRSADARAADAGRVLRTRRGARGRVLGPLAYRLATVARRGVAFREDSHCLAFMLPAAAVRRLLLELGGRMARAGDLDDPTDIVFLEPTELTELPTGALRELATRRRKQREAALADRAGGTVAGDGTVRGIPSSRGTVEATVRVIVDEDDFGRLSAGEVLVCRYTNPAWTPLFATAGAVVTDAGGAMSHAAIVAREYGIPAVMGTGDATLRLGDGDRVRVDGTAGTVTLVQPPP